MRTAISPPQTPFLVSLFCLLLVIGGSGEFVYCTEISGNVGVEVNCEASNSAMVSEAVGKVPGSSTDCCGPCTDISVVLTELSESPDDTAAQACTRKLPQVPARSVFGHDYPTAKLSRKPLNEASQVASNTNSNPLFAFQTDRLLV